MRLGIMGGTFDPIHRGHIHMAQAALAELSLDQILLLPGGDPPHKAPHAASHDRLAMVRLAAGEDLRFTWSDIEMLRPGCTYTVDTLRLLHNMYPNAQLTYLIGSDTLKLLNSWKSPEEVVHLCDMAVMLRGEDTREDILALMAQLKEQFGLCATLLAQRGLDISSTRIREAAALGEPLNDWVPDSIAAYIQEHHLYTPGSQPAPGDSVARDLLLQLGVVKRGHYVRASGRHADAYVQCARAFERAEHAQIICGELVRRFTDCGAQVVLSAAVGGLILSYEMGRQMNLPSLYCERTEGALALSRGFHLTPGTKVLIVEDEVTTGASLREMKQLVADAGCEVVGIGCLVDKTDSRVDFDPPLSAILSIKAENHPSFACPMCQRGQALDGRER